MVRQVRDYGLAVAGIAVSFAIALPLRGLVADPPQFLVFTPAVFLAAYFFGAGPGILASVLGAFASSYYFTLPFNAWPVNAIGWGPTALFIAIGAGISLLAENLAENRRHLQAQARELEAARAAAERLAQDVDRRARDFDTLFDVTPIGIAVASDPACTDIRINRALAVLLQLDPANPRLDGSPDALPFVVHMDGEPVSLENLPIRRAAREGVETRGVELDIVRRDGTRVSLYEFAAPLVDEHGRARGAVGAFLDITDRRRVDQELRFLNDASRVLAASLDYEASVRELVRLAVPSLADWSVLDMRPAGATMTRVAWAHREPDKDRWLAEHAPPLGGAEGGPSTLDLVHDGQPRLLTDVSPDWFRAHLLPQADDTTVLALGAQSVVVVPLVLQGRVIGALAWVRSALRAFYDQRDLALAEELARRAATAVENARLYREAREASQLKDHFLATLSHEMRTPLNALLGWIQLLKSGQLAPGKQAKALEAIERSARLQQGLTAELLDISRAITGKLRIEPQVVQVGPLVEGAVDALRPAAESKDLRLVLHRPDRLPPLVLDPARLQQMVWNLLSNAIKFTPRGGAIDVRLGLDAGELAFEVQDTGIGIAPEFLPFVFDRFRQADLSSTREHGGLGLGLAIVRHLAELHGGTVTAQSAGPHLGARFAVRLPVTIASADAQAPAAAAAPRLVLQGVPVLLVDADTRSRDLLRAMLEQHGALVSEAVTLEAAWEAFQADPPGVVVTATSGAGRDAYALLERIRARGVHQGGGTPVILVTAQARAEDRAAALAAGFQAYLTGPVDEVALVGTLASLRLPALDVAPVDVTPPISL